MKMLCSNKNITTVAVSIILTATPVIVQATQITPNPNPEGSTIDIINDLAAFNNEDPFSNGGIINIDSGSTLTNEFGATLNNYENDSSNCCGGTLNNAGTLINYGVLASDYDGATLTNDGTLINYGGLSNISGAALINAIGATVNNYGDISNAFNVATLTNNGTFNNFSGATLSNSSFLGGAFLTNSGTLNNFAGATWVNSDEAHVSNSFGGTINNFGMMQTDIPGVDNYGTFNNVGTWWAYFSKVNNFAGATLNNYGYISGGPTPSPPGAPRLTNDGTLNNFSGATLVADSLMNTGTLNNAGSIIGGFAQTAGQTINNGTITGGAYVDGGSLRGTGVIIGDVTLENGTLLAPGDTTTMGTFTINGDLQSSGDLVFRLDGLDLGEFDTLNIQGDALFTGGTVGFDFLDYTPMAGNNWDFLFADSITGWETLHFDFDDLSPDLTYAFNYANGVETLSLHSAPEPSTLLLLGSGLVMLFAVSRKQFTRTD
jgi:PEP-CTERM motif